MDELGKVKKLEGEVEVLIQKAHDEGAAQIKKARAKKADIVDKKRKASEKKAASLLDATRQKAEEDSIKIREDAVKNIAELEKLSKKNFDKAVQLVVSELSG